MKRILKRAVESLGLSPLIYPRVRLARKHLSGTGVEIGALWAPLRLPPGANAKYIDICSREESIRKFPELDPRDIVEVDYVANGFTLEGVPSSEFDFLIANHVLEHSPDPIGSLVQWYRVIKPGGKLFCSVPILYDWFDNGRVVTDFQHMLGDHEAARAGRLEELAERNKSHYREWLSISEPAILKRPALPEVDLDRRILEMVERGEEIHFHTFTPDSVRHLFAALAENRILPGVRVLNLVGARKEVVVVAQKG